MVIILFCGDSVMDTRSAFAAYGLSTPALSLEGLFTPARIVDMYDGDTGTLVMPFKGEYYKFTCRMLGIDTCEMKSKIKENKENAIKARNRVLQLVGLPTIELTSPYTRKKVQAMLQEHVTIAWVQCHKPDKYGRYLIDMYPTQDKTKSIANILVEEKLAYEYFGDTKLTEEEQADQM